MSMITTAIRRQQPEPRLRRLILLVITATVFASCAHTERLANTRGHPGEVTGYDAFDPLKYYDIWNGDLSLPPPVPNRQITRDDWARIVKKEKERGVNSPDGNERALLFQGATKAYLMSVRGTGRTIVAVEGT
jgi:hypothetical protein